METRIRPETPADYAAIDRVNNLAFDQGTEARLIHLLRKREDFIPALSLVAVRDTEVIGHILFSPIQVVHQQRRYPSLALAPMAVRPDWQGKGIGSLLVEKGLEAVVTAGHRSAIVLGHPKFYPRFGFRPASLWNIKPPFDLRDELFMAIELTEGALKGVRGTVEYPPEFLED